MQNSHQLASITVNSNYTATIRTNADLTLNNGGSMASGRIAQNVFGSIAITGGTFTWTAGTIEGIDDTSGLISVSQCSKFIVNPRADAGSPGYLLGSNLSIEPSGSLELNNNSVPGQPNSLILTNAAQILNAGYIEINASNSLGVFVQNGTPAAVIQNFSTGQISQNGTNDTYDISNAINNLGGRICVTGTLQVDGADTANSGYSISQSSGYLELGSGASLIARNGLLVSGGELLATKRSQVTTTNNSVWVNGGTINVGDSFTQTNAVNDPTLVIASGLRFDSGTLQFYWNGANRGTWIQTQGGVNVAQTNTAVAVTFANPQPATYDVIRCFQGQLNISSTAATNPAGYTASIATDNVKIYRLQRQAQGMNHAPEGTNNTVTTSVNTPYQFSADDFGFTDPDDSPTNNLQAVEVTTLPGSGTLTDNGSAVNATDLVSASDIIAGQVVFTPANNVIGSPYTSFTFQVQDDGGTIDGGVNLDPAPKTMTINVSASAQVTGLSQTSGPATGATAVTITGVGFTGATAVNFGGTAATSFTVNSDTSITAVAPAHSSGDVDITVTTSADTSATSSADVFTFVSVGLINPGNQVSYVGTSVSLSLDAWSTNGVLLTWTATGLPPGLSLHDGVLTAEYLDGTVDSGAATGDYSVTITATDPTSGAFCTVSFIWTIDSMGGLMGP